MSQKYLLRSLIICLLLVVLNACSTGEVPLQNTEFKFRTIKSKLIIDQLDDLYENSDILFLNQVLTSEQKEKVYDRGYFVFTDNREVSLISKRPFMNYKNWLMPTIPGRQVPGVISQLTYEFFSGRELAVFIVTLNDQVDIKDVAQRSEMIDKLYLSISGSAILIVSSDDEDYTNILQRRISAWESMEINAGDYTLYTSEVRDWELKSKKSDNQIYNIYARSYQKERMGMTK